MSFLGLKQRLGILAAIQAHVDEAIAGDLERLHSRDLAHGGDQFFGDQLRSLLQFPRQLKGHRNRQLPERGLLGLLERYLQIEVEPFSQRVFGGGCNAFFDVLEHCFPV